MPYSGAGDPGLPANVLRLSSKRQRQWISVYDSARERGFDDGRAIRVANGVLKKQLGHSTASARSFDDVVSGGGDIDDWMERQLIGDWPDADCEYLDGPPAASAPVVAGVQAGQAGRAMGPGEPNQAGTRFVGEYGYDTPQLSWGEAGYEPYGASEGRGCATCRWFMAPSSCVIVRGAIVPTGRSDYYSAASEVGEAGERDHRVVGTAISGARQILAAARDGGDVGIPLVDRFLNWLDGADGGVEQLAGESDGEAGGRTSFGLREMPDGRLRFFTFASNNYEDRGRLIFVEAAQREYEAWAERTGNWPEVWLWHARGSKFAQVDKIFWDGHIQVSTGLVDVGREDLARRLAEASGRGEVGMSHGYIGHHREMDDGTVEVVQFREFEQSVLPLWAAANYGTYFGLAGGGQAGRQEVVDMAQFRQEQRDWLRTTGGLSDQEIDDLERQTSAMQERFEAVGVNWRSLDMADGTPGGNGAPSAAAPANGGLSGEGAGTGTASPGAPAPVAATPTPAGGSGEGSASPAPTPTSSATPAGVALTEDRVRQIIGETLEPALVEIRSLAGGVRSLLASDDDRLADQWQARARGMPQGFQASRQGAAPSAGAREAAVAPGAAPTEENPLGWTEEVFAQIPALAAPPNGGVVSGGNGRV